MTSASLMGILTFIIGVPAVAVTLRIMPFLHRPFLFLLAFTTCHVKKPFYMEVFYIPYRGTDRGFGVTLTDLLFFGFLLYLIYNNGRPHKNGIKKLIWWPYNSFPWLIIIVLSSMSLIQSEAMNLSLFTIHKFIRGLILYWVVVNTVHDRKDIKAIINGVLAAVVFQGMVVLYYKYVTGTVVYRSVGTFPHPNSLGLYVDMVIPIALSLLLSNTLKKAGNVFAAAAVILGIIIIIFTKSRASLVVMGTAVVTVTLLSFIGKVTLRKILVIMVGMVVLSIVGIKAAPRIVERFQKAPQESARTRVYFNDAARAMANDYFFGVGINTFSYMLEHSDYYWYVYPDQAESDKALEFREGRAGRSRLGTAHHNYYLFAGEIGWLGMYIFIIFVLRLYWRNLVLYMKEQDPFENAIAMGLLVGFTTLHLQSFYEWGFRQTQVFYLYFLLSGFLIALWNQGVLLGWEDTKIVRYTAVLSSGTVNAIRDLIRSKLRG